MLPGYQTFVLTSEYNEVKAKVDSMNADSDELREFTKQRTKWLHHRRQVKKT